jgi:hypothetical protein
VPLPLADVVPIREARDHYRSRASAVQAGAATGRSATSP